MNDLESFSGDELFIFMSEEPLLAHLFVRSEVIEDDSLEYLAGTSIAKGRIRLLLNPKKFAELEIREKVGVLVHEYLHILLGHCTTRITRDLSKSSKQNVAQDMAINQLILASGVWRLPREGVFHNVPPFFYEEGLTAEEYFYLIDRDFSDEEIEELYGGIAIDYHGDWEDSSQQNKTIVQEIVQDYINKGRKDVGETLGSSKGHSDILERILARDANDSSWLTEAKQFLCQSANFKKRRTYKRPSRRYPFPAKGAVPQKQAKVAAIVDTSFSMEPKTLGYILQSINQMCAIMHVDVIMCDTDVKGNVIKRFRPTSDLDFRGRGGTEMQPAFDYADKEGYKSIICFTDGGIYSDVKSEKQTFWVCINNKLFRPKFGRICHVNWK